MEQNATPQTIIDAQVEIVGTIKSKGTLRMEGRLEGDLQCEGDVQIGKTAVIKGNMTVNSVSVAGTINGNIIARDRIEMKSTAKVLGDIKSKRLAVEDGVTFIGRSEVNPTGEPVTAAPAAPPAPAPAPKRG